MRACVVRDDLVSIVVQSRFGVSIGALSIVMFIVYYLARYCTLWNIHSYAAGYCILFQYCTVPPVCSQTTRHQNCCCYYKFSAFTKNHKTQHLTTRTSSIHSRLKIGRCQKNGNGKNGKNDKNGKNGKNVSFKLLLATAS